MKYYTLFTPLLHCLLIYYTCDVNICVEMDPGTHMLCIRLCPFGNGCDTSSSIKSHQRGDNKKKMKKVVYYETDSSSPSTSGTESSTTSKRHECNKYSKMPLRYPRISKHALLLSVPLGKPPYFDGKDYFMWSDKMRHHLTSLHESIWDIVEFGA